jgi:hypothetical protein
MATLSIPAPSLVLDPPTGPAALEKPVTFRIGAATLMTGEAVPTEEMVKVGAFLFRGSTGSEEIWDEAAKGWTPSPLLDPASLASWPSLGLAPDHDAPTWTGTLVATGQKDAAGQDKIIAATGGVPLYRLRVIASARHAGADQLGLSPASPDFAFFSQASKTRFGVTLDPNDAMSAERVRLMLRDSNLQPTGYIEIRSTGGREVEIANIASSGATLARILLADDGSIRLSPAAGQAILLDGRLDADEVTYMSGGVRHTL